MDTNFFFTISIFFKDKKNILNSIIYKFIYRIMVTNKYYKTKQKLIILKVESFFFK